MLIVGRVSLLSNLGVDAPTAPEHWHGEVFLSRGLNFDVCDCEEVDPLVMHVVTQTEVLTLAVDHDTSKAHTWHEPRNEREYLRSPQHALWRTAKENKMDKYMALNLWELSTRASSPSTRRSGRTRSSSTARASSIGSTLAGASRAQRWTATCTSRFPR